MLCWWPRYFIDQTESIPKVALIRSISQLQCPLRVSALQTATTALDLRRTKTALEFPWSLTETSTAICSVTKRIGRPSPGAAVTENFELHRPVSLHPNLTSGKGLNYVQLESKTDIPDALVRRSKTST